MDLNIIKEWTWVIRNWVKRSPVRTNLCHWWEKLLTWQCFWKSFREYQEISPASYKLSLDNLYPCLGDDTADTDIEPIYFYQDSWAFERIVKNKPAKHIDIGSHHKFVALLSKVVDLTMVDIRPLSLPMNSIKFLEGSILRLPFENDSIESLSSLCVVEHIGLGRYGDPLDPEGSEKSLQEINRVLKPGGHIYFSVPVSDRDITAFNAGRIFGHEKLLEKLSEEYTIEDKKYIHGSDLTDTFIPHDRFGTTVLLELKKNK